MWQPIVTAPYDRDLELAVIDGKGEHSLVFPCRRTEKGWVDAKRNGGSRSGRRTGASGPKRTEAGPYPVDRDTP